MQNDIIVKKPPVSADPQYDNLATELPPQDDTAISAKPEQAIEAVIPKSNVPVGVIVLAVFICLCLISAAVYGSMTQ